MEAGAECKSENVPSNFEGSMLEMVSYPKFRAPSVSFPYFSKQLGKRSLQPAIRNNCSFTRIDAHWLQWLLLSPLYSLIIDQLFYVFLIFVEISPMDPPKQCNENLPPLPYHLAFWSCTDLVKFEIHVQRSDTSDYPNSTKFYLFLPK